MRHLSLRYILLSATLLLLMAVLAIQNLATDQRRPAVPLKYKDTLVSQEEWIKYGRQMAERDGLKGSPTREEMALMSYGSYLTLIGENDTALTCENPVIVYQVWGDIPVLTILGLGGGSTSASGLNYVFDGLTGSPVHSTIFDKNRPDLGVLDLSFIPADLGLIGQSLHLPTIIAVTPSLSTHITPESTLAVIPLPAVP